MTTRKAPQDCASMQELRVEIDALDEQLIDLLATRTGYIDRAVELKRIEKLPARTKDRVAQVLAQVRAAAELRGLDPDMIEKIWTELIEWSIAREESKL